jgi:hypothetical protein
MKPLLDNGTLVTLGLVGVVAAVGAANKAGLYGSRSTRPTDAELRAVGRYTKMHVPEERAHARLAGQGTGDLAIGKHVYSSYEADSWQELLDHVREQGMVKAGKGSRALLSASGLSKLTDAELEDYWESLSPSMRNTEAWHLAVTERNVREYRLPNGPAYAAFKASRRSRGSPNEGSASYGVAVSASVEKDSLSGLWSVHLHNGRYIVNVTGDVFTTKAAADREAKAMLAQSRAGVAIDTLGSMFWEKHHKPLGGSRALRGAPHAGPSVQRMVDFLQISKGDAAAIKARMDAGVPYQTLLEEADRLLNGNGVEYIQSHADTMRSQDGLSYVNKGDTYDTTLLYDHKTGRFSVGSWGDIVERQPRRFE